MASSKQIVEVADEIQRLSQDLTKVNNCMFTRHDISVNGEYADEVLQSAFTLGLAAKVREIEDAIQSAAKSLEEPSGGNATVATPATKL